MDPYASVFTINQIQEAVTYYSCRYACSREETDVFVLSHKERLCMGGKIYGNRLESGSFYLNGSTSPLGRAADAELFWDESVRAKYLR
jgi:hypothetical protein